MPEYALKLINGVARMREISNAGSGIYDNVYVVGVGGLTAGTAISLPNGGTYDDLDLEVFLGGQFLEPNSVDYDYVGSGPDKTQISFVENLLEGDRIHLRTESANIPIYDEITVVTSGGIITGTNITLPNGGTYEGVDLEIYLNGEFLEKDLDWNEVGSLPRTQIQMTFDLVEGDRLRFRIDHAL